MKSLILIFTITFLSLTTWAKKNVCAITINSNQEINLFKKSLSKDQWNFIELTKYGDEKPKSNNPNSWFLNSCNANIQCDILVISGHFGGTFFGESNFQLPLEELEKNACNKKCDGIINQPKEVFLFGCNTLAGKEKDNRTPEEYFDVLMSDGFTRQQAEQVVAFRYSAFGNSFSARMSQVFENSPRIYGFSSIGPSGETIEPLLSKYLKSSKSEYQNFDKYNETSGATSNKKLFSALKNSAIAQATGLKVADPASKSIERPYCYLENNDNSRINKLKYVTEVLVSGRSLTMIPYIKDFIHNLLKQNDISADEKLLLQQISASDQVRNDFNKILKLKEDVYLSARINVLKLMKDLSLVSNTEFENYFSTIVDFSKPITSEKVDQICSIDIQFEVNVDTVSAENKNSDLFYRLVRCVKPQNEKIQKLLVEALKNGNAPVRNAAATGLAAIKTESEAILISIVDVMKNHTNSDARSIAASILGRNDLKNKKVFSAMLEIITSHSDAHIRMSVIYMIEKYKPTEDSVHTVIANALKSDASYHVRSGAAWTLGNVAANSEANRKILLDASTGDENENVRNAAAKALQTLNTRFK